MFQRSHQLLVSTIVAVFLAFAASPALAEQAPCAVCSTEQSRIHEEECSFSETWDGHQFYFCQSRCRDTFLEEPESWSNRFLALRDAKAAKKQIEVGDEMPRFRLPLEPIGSIGTEDLADKVVLINGWASWCAPCMEEMPALIKLQEEFKDKGLVVLGLSFDKSREKHRETVAEKSLNFPSIYADQPEVQKFLESVGEFEAIPFTLIVDRDGKLVERLDRAGTYDEFQELVKPHLLPPEEASEQVATGSVVPS